MVFGTVYYVASHRSMSYDIMVARVFSEHRYSTTVTYRKCQEMFKSIPDALKFIRDGYTQSSFLIHESNFERGLRGLDVNTYSSDDIEEIFLSNPEYFL